MKTSRPKHTKKFTEYKERWIYYGIRILAVTYTHTYAKPTNSDCTVVSETDLLPIAAVWQEANTRESLRAVALAGLRVLGPLQ